MLLLSTQRQLHSLDFVSWVGNTGTICRVQSDPCCGVQYGLEILKATVTSSGHMESGLFLLAGYPCQ